MSRALLLALAGFARALPAGAQIPADTTRPRQLEPVIVTAERARASLAGATAAVTRLDGATLTRYPRATLADLLRLVPGFTLVDFDGLGFDPQIMVRGFYGGGQAEYVVVLVDGVPVNRLETGTVAWDVLPPVASIEAIEVMRGGGSSLYGDAAIGGVINVVTRAIGGPAGMAGQASAGSFAGLRAEAEAAAPASWRRLRLGAAAERTGGWREHSGRNALKARAGFPILERTGGTVQLTATAHWRDFEEPGPLLDSILESARRTSDPLFRFDHTTERSYRAVVTGAQTVRLGRASGFVSAERRSTDGVRTLALAPGYGDTKERVAASRGLAAGAQFERETGAGRLIAGIEGSLGGFDSKYYSYFGGSREQYGSGAPERGDLETDGSATRIGGAAFAHYAMAAGPMRLFLGARWDGLQDRFEARLPSDRPGRADHGAFSPKLGASLRYLGTSNSSGSIYAAVSRSFKAPTLDQLYDQRMIPVPFPPGWIRTSNPGLEPQRGSNLELGLYHQALIGRGEGIRGAISLSGYQTAMTDEVDFQLETFRYVNIGKSRHRGLEAGLQVDGPFGSVFVAWALQDAVSRSGDHRDKRLKAIPRNTVNAGASFSLPGPGTMTAAVLLTRTGGTYLDDANTIRLPGHTRVDLRMTARAAGFILFGDVRNLFGAQYSTTGYPDPSGSGSLYLFPAAPRVVEAGVRREW